LHTRALSNHEEKAAASQKVLEMDTQLAELTSL
jgi:hypothetical protein